MNSSRHIEPKVAVLITGTYREVEFLLRLFPHMAGPAKHDIFLVLRHTDTTESSHFGAKEQDFEIARLTPFLDKRLFLCELPSIDPTVVSSRYLIPVGPTDVDRECGMLSMLHGVVTATAMMKSSLRRYTHVMKTRTDYLPWVVPWLSGMLEMYEQSGRRIVVDGSLTKPQRYPDRPDIPWQGSISDVFCFASVDQFLALWDIEEILPKVWTGVAETTLFRAAMLRFLGDDLQSPRRNASLLQKHFTWESNDTKQSFHLLRAGVLSEEMKQTVLHLLDKRGLSAESAHRVIRTSYDFIVGAILNRGGFRDDLAAKMTRTSYPGESELELLVKECLPDSAARTYLEACRVAAAKARPV